MARFELTSVTASTPESGPRRWAAATLLATAALLTLATVPALPAAAAGRHAAPAHGGKSRHRAPRVSLSVPSEVTAGTQAVAMGTIVPGQRRGRVVLQRRTSSRWVRLAGGKAHAKRYHVPFVLRSGNRQIQVRAVLFERKRRIAASDPRVIVVKASGGAKQTEPAEGAGPAYWGAWIGDQLTGVQPPWDMTAVSNFEQMVGKSMSILEFSSPFADCSKLPCSFYEFPTALMESVRQHGSIPLLSWASQANGNQRESEFQLSDVIAGAYDSYIREFAEAAKAWGHPYFLRFDWEMNGPWFGWGEGANGNKPGEFITAWRHVHDIFAAVGATNATWVWCPYVHGGTQLGAPGPEAFYPGSTYVDWTCLDGYDWGTNPAAPYGWNSFGKLYTNAYHQITEAIAPGKPMMLGEVAASEYGGSKAGWIQEMFAALRTELQDVRALVWFEKSGNGEDWPLESSASALSAFASGVQESRYAGNEFSGLATSPIPPP